MSVGECTRLVQPSTALHDARLVTFCIVVLPTAQRDLASAAWHEQHPLHPLALKQHSADTLPTGGPVLQSCQHEGNNIDTDYTCCQSQAGAPSIAADS